MNISCILFDKLYCCVEFRVWNFKKCCANHGQGDAIDWTDEYTTLVCKFFANKLEKGTG